MGALSILQLALLPSLACAFATPAAGPRASPLSLPLSSNDDDFLASRQPPPDVMCVGETLWDSLPSGIYLGGAPSNVAVHLASLFASSPASKGEAARTVAIAACVGDDQLGKEAIRRLALKEVRTDYVQSHPEWDTGMATAIIGENGDATYEFVTPAAWDGLDMDDQLSETLGLDGDGEQGHAGVFVMGTIAARLGSEYGATSASTLKTIRNAAPEGTVVLDVNLRSPWYAPGEVLGLIRGDEPARKLALLKLNEEELPLLEQWCGLEQSSLDSGGGGENLQGSMLERRMDQLASLLNTERVCVTRGCDGAALLCKDDSSDLFCEHDGYSLAVSNDSDTVGAGDAFLAALVNSLFICSESPEKALERACALGGYVAGCRGATPEHGDAPEELRRIFSDVI